MTAEIDWTQRIARYIRPDGTVIVPPRAARWLVNNADLSRDRRIGMRDTDPEGYAVLTALTLVALSDGAPRGPKTVQLEPDPTDSDEWITAEQAAERLGIHRRTVRKWCTTKRLTAVKSGRDWMIRRVDVDAAAA